jgi:hypothetical protein
MAAHAQAVVDTAEAEKALRLLTQKYPQQADISLPMPTPADVRTFRTVSRPLRPFAPASAGSFNGPTENRQ